MIIYMSTFLGSSWKGAEQRNCGTFLDILDSSNKKNEITQGSLNYPFGGNETLQMNGIEWYI